MFDSPDQDDEARAAGDSLQVSALLGFAALVSPDVGQIGPEQGTVDTSVEAVERTFYREGSETLISGAPVSTKRDTSAQPSPRLRAKDLIAELNTINRQIHRIMFQVERAVTRLGTSG